MTGSSSSSSGMTPPLASVKAEPEETSEHRRSHVGNLVIDEGCRQPSPPHGHLRLVRTKKEPVMPLIVKQEHAEMAADLDTDLKWSRDDYVREEMERQRQAPDEIVVRRHGCEEGGVLVLDDIDEETPTQTTPVRSGDPGQGCSKDDDNDDNDYTAFYQLLDMN
ncbi:Cysteine-rich receptor-like protein kinase 10 [Hordeum vulgare]|nr:Cysteine-rich receptor-like protein kinase 10 [Hordeum vulgare]